MLYVFTYLLRATWFMATNGQHMLPWYHPHSFGYNLPYQLPCNSDTSGTTRSFQLLQGTDQWPFVLLCSLVSETLNTDEVVRQVQVLHCRLMLCGQLIYVVRNQVRHRCSYYRCLQHVFVWQNRTKAICCLMLHIVIIDKLQWFIMIHLVLAGRTDCLTWLS